MRRVWISFLLLITISFTAGAILPADTLKKSTLDEVVVTATKTTRKVLDVPTRIQALPAHRLKANNLLSVDNILLQVSGVNVDRTMGIYSKRSTVSARGMGSDQGRTLILLDGIPLNKLSTGSVNFNMLNTDGIERIEVVKGPNSSLFGGNAMGGTVNIITRLPEEKISGSVSVDYGSFNTIGTSAHISSKLGKFLLGVNGFYRHGDGFNSTVDSLRDETTIKGSLEEYKAGGFVGYQFNERHTVKFNASYYDGKRGTGTRIFHDDFGVLDAAARYKNQEYRLKYTGEEGNSFWELSAFYLGEKISELKSKKESLFDVDSKRDDWGAWFNYSYKGWKYNTVTAGLEYKGGSVDGRDIYRTSTDVVINKGTSNSFALFLQDEIALLNNNFTIVPSVRFDYVEFGDGGFFVEDATKDTEFLKKYAGSLADASWTAWSPKLALQYKFSPYDRIYASVGSGFRPGSLEDMCRSGFISSGFVVANPDLGAEKILTYEIGGDVRLAKGLRMSPSVYYSDGRDFIHAIRTGEMVQDGKKQRAVLQVENIAKVRIVGVEVDVNYSITDDLELFANYSYTDSKIKDYKLKDMKDIDLTDKYLTYVPKNMFSAGATWRNKVVNINAIYRYKSKQFMNDENTEEPGEVVEGYSMFDAKLWHTFKNMLTISLCGDNIFDKVYSDSYDTISMGRYLYAKVEFNF